MGTPANGSKSQGKNSDRNKKRRQAKAAKGKSARKNVTKPIAEAEDVIAVEDEEAADAAPVKPQRLKLRVNIRPRAAKIAKK